ncbi:hypothetical protein ACFYOG_28580 [Streptomyces sp. NPDC007818]|uniref:hypothetical protein n=1 Tax=Streptomyces sp. NPDC007818 TaxID=3364780 RepID=UPI00369E64E4
MLSVPRDRTHPHLLLAQAVALTGRGLATVALALAVFGAGSITVALLLSRLLGRSGGRALMPPAATSAVPTPAG